MFLVLQLLGCVLFRFLCLKGISRCLGSQGSWKKFMYYECFFCLGWCIFCLKVLGCGVLRIISLFIMVGCEMVIVQVIMLFQLCLMIWVCLCLRLWMSVVMLVISVLMWYDFMFCGFLLMLQLCWLGIIIWNFVWVSGLIWWFQLCQNLGKLCSKMIGGFCLGLVFMQCSCILFMRCLVC